MPRICKQATAFELSPTDPEVKQHTVINCVQSVKSFTPMVERLKRFSNFHSAVRAIELLQSVARQYQNRCSADKSKKEYRDYNKAKNFVITEFQRELYGSEMSLLGDGKPLPKKNFLNKLNPYLDNDGIIRVGGRLSPMDNINDMVKFPVIVPRKSHLATLVIRANHDSHHQGRGITIANIRDRGYWIVGCTSAVKSYLYHCITCRKLRHEPLTQKMSDMPKFRIETLGPFVHTGMDCFGPFQVKNGRRHSKAYGIVFTCLSSRAVHLELLDDMSSDAFLNALRCLISLRGQVLTLTSDQATNFKGASSELKNALAQMNERKVKKLFVETYD